jgi:CHAT domain-containing protein
MALTRGFLVAGVRRALTSNWLVDDRAAATLVTAYCARLSASMKSGSTPDYAAALREAKRQVRRMNAWDKPYYWAGLVLVGPP